MIDPLAPKSSAGSSCEKFVFWKFCAIIIIALISIILKLIGQLLDHIISGAAGRYSVAAWLVAFVVSLGLGAFFEKILNVRNMWKNPFGGK